MFVLYSLMDWLPDYDGSWYALYSLDICLTITTRSMGCEGGHSGGQSFYQFCTADFFRKEGKIIQEQQTNTI